MTARWITLVGLVLLMGVVGVALVDYETNRKAADEARIDAETARAGCLYGRAAFTIAERKRRHARCEALPGPVREARRVERRWDRRAPWYGLAVGTILLPAVAAFAVARRRLAATSPSSRPIRRWRMSTRALTLLIGFLAWVAFFYLVGDRWDELVEATGGSTAECGVGSDCGTLGEFTEAHPVILGAVLLVAAAAPAGLAGWLAGRFFRSLDVPGDGEPAPTSSS